MKTRISLILVFMFVFSAASPQSQPESADALLKKAYVQAAKEKKNVFVIFHASWCGWCKKLDASINDPACSDFFNKNFVFVHLTVLESKEKKNLENPGATEIFNKYSGGNQGIPYFLIFNKKGALLADSKIRPAGAGLDQPGNNMGCPAAPEEIAAFIEVLKKTSKINDEEIKAINERFSKNKN